MCRNNLATSCIYVREYTLGRALIARACSRGSLGRVWVIWLLWCVSVQGWRMARDVFTVCPLEYLWFAVLDCSEISTVYLMRLEKNYPLETSREISYLEFKFWRKSCIDLKIIFFYHSFLFSIDRNGEFYTSWITTLTTKLKN